MSDPLALRAAQEAILASGTTLARPGGLCGPCVELLPVTGAAVCTLSGPINNETVCASDDVAFRIDELQFDLGEGPCWEAFASRRPVLVPDLRDGRPVTPWPVFNTAVRETSAAALFAFPLYVGGTGIGALDLYRSTAGPLDEEALRDARILADTVAIEVMRRILAAIAREEAEWIDPPPEPDPTPARDPWQESPRSRREIHQATGMIMDQLDLTVGAALARLRAHAFATDSSVADVAHEIVNRRLRFPRDSL
jgi:GAF domain-containing protein